MMPWVIAIVVAVAAGVVFVIRDAQIDDKRRKERRRPTYDNY